jgi:quercetin dioxygenase-like cupin family protein
MGKASVRTPYSEWVRDEGLRIQSGNYQRDLGSVELDPWERMGCHGTILNHDKSNESNDCWVLEIEPGGSTRRERHLFEEMVYVLSGRGATQVWSSLDDQETHTFEWQTGSLFSVPLNAVHQYFNGDGSEPVRLLVVTNAPVVVNNFRTMDFIFNSDYAFTDRFAGEKTYFNGEGTLDGRMWSTNFIADVRAFELIDYPERGGGGRNIQLSLAGNSMKAHISEFAVGRYKKAHRHGAGAHVIILDGQGYSLMWRGGDKPARYDWSPGSLIVPADGWFHQHFNTGTEPARYLALRYQDNRLFNAEGVPYSNISTRIGGDQIEYEDEEAEVRDLYEAELAKSGLTPAGDLTP